MTTVSVQPTTSEPNERESFENWYKSEKNPPLKQIYDTPAKDCAYHAWKHQQKRIDELEELLSDRTGDVKFEYERAESLQAKLNVAVEGLKYFQTFSNGAGTATAILENIEKIGE